MAECGLDVDATVDGVLPDLRSPGVGRGSGRAPRPLPRHRDHSSCADAEAIALVQRCEDRHTAVPRDLSVVAYDDEVAGLFSPPLTAVRPPRRSIGRAAVHFVADRLADPDRPSHRA